MKKYYFTLLLSFLITVGFSQDSKKDYTEAFKLIEAWLDAQKDFDRLPGISAIAIDDQEILWAGSAGFANVEKNIEADPSTLCGICSISKLFTAVAIMKLYDDGKLRLDDKVSDLLPSYNLEQKYPESGPITIRTLLTHSSGLPREADFPYWTGPDFTFPTKEQINAKLIDQETLYPASTYFHYSNLGIALLGEIIEELSGVSYDEYVEQNILLPLGLSATRTELPEPLYGNQLAIGYSTLLREGNREKVKLYQANRLTPAAGFSSNVQDLGKFASWQFRLRDTTATEILKPSTLKYMQNVHWTDPDWNTTWGLGFVVSKAQDGNTYVGHSGLCPGYSTILQIDLKNKRAYSVMINANGTSPSKYVAGINAILQKVTNTKKEGSADSKVEKENLQEYVGYYGLMPVQSEFFVSTWDGKLIVLPLPSEKPGDALISFKHIESDTFRRVRDDGELGETIVFERDKNGKIMHIKHNGNYIKKNDK